MRLRFPEGALPLFAAGLALLGSVGATGVLYRSAARALAEAQEARLMGAGEAAALLFSDVPVSAPRLAGLMEANGLDGAYVVDGDLRVVADAMGPARAKVDLLRTDPALLEQALAGRRAIAASYALGSLEVATGYFPIRGPRQEVRAVLALEVGRALAAPRAKLRQALGLGIGVALLGAGALAMAARRWARSEQERRVDAARAAHGAAIAQMAAMAAHEFRNPLGVIRGTVELLRERLRPGSGDGEALDDVLSEVMRMRRLTDDFLELSADRALNLGEVELERVLEEVGRATEATFPDIRVRYEARQLPRVHADAERLRQVFSNLLTNAAQAQGKGELQVLTFVERGHVRVEVQDHGPGVPEALRTRLFVPFVTGKSDGTGLGLALSRRFLERHGGSLSLKCAGPGGSTFEARLPIAGPSEPRSERQG